MPTVVVGIAQSTIAATGVLRAIRVATAPRDIDAALAMLMLMHCSSHPIAATAVKAGLVIDYRLPAALALSSCLVRLRTRSARLAQLC